MTCVPRRLGGNVSPLSTLLDPAWVRQRLVVLTHDRRTDLPAVPDLLSSVFSSGAHQTSLPRRGRPASLERRRNRVVAPTGAHTHKKKTARSCASFSMDRHFAVDTRIGQQDTCPVESGPRSVFCCARSCAERASTGERSPLRRRAKERIVPIEIADGWVGGTPGLRKSRTKDVEDGVPRDGWIAGWLHAGGPGVGSE